MKDKKFKRPNPVAKHLRTFNKSKVFRDRTKYDKTDRKRKLKTWKELQDGLMNTIEDPDGPEL
jgi:hypothetical protein